MNNIRVYGQAPYTVALLHGGPGAPGTMAPVAHQLMQDRGVLEMIQTTQTLEDQVEELKAQLMHHDTPIKLVGHSWGAWLAWIFAARYPKMVSHLILIGSGPFDARYTREMMDKRMANLDEEGRVVVNQLLNQMQENGLSDEAFARLGRWMDRADSYCALDRIEGEDPLPAQPTIYESVWPQAAALRASGQLLAMHTKIRCPITFIHGTHDPHPYEGIQDVLNEAGVDFEFILMDRCGHTPWKEKHKAEAFYRLLNVLLDE